MLTPRCLVAFWICTTFLVMGCQPSKGIPIEDRPFSVRRAEFKTNLLVRAPSPQRYETETPPKGIDEVEYESGNLRLKAWVYVPNGDRTKRHKTIVYLHGGFAFGSSDFNDCISFARAGFLVMTPWLRGENGLPGNFECYWGEVDDAIAAVNWAAKQPYVDAEKIYVFGHSSGGQLSALMSLAENVPIQSCGSSGGLYDTSIFDHMPTERVPFDKSNPIERQLRVLPGNQKWMTRPHFAYVGRQDSYVMKGSQLSRQEQATGLDKLKIIELEGDHGTSLPFAIEAYIKQIQETH